MDKQQWIDGVFEETDIDYTIAGAVTDSATFFGTNF